MYLSFKNCPISIKKFVFTGKPWKYDSLNFLDDTYEVVNHEKKQ